ncbi:histidine triad nucleotide-binding protein [Nocardioides zeae]|uniref:Histidine triad nucleotide-binding protein n=1 Tax=Nocardioides imazamoxiresistens TaxID=3231893 RepID=A0ABU3Q144_9ACTN|nr:histidine triad nucleotide-binding protein [Nocardioides zeae]MDT9595223.1 histidine triad nucleotide-binding protein [Nocardioides zeae]
MSAECLFCKIVAGQIPATVVHETPTTVAFRDVNPVAPTHVLVVPRTHQPNAAALAAAEPATAADLLTSAQAVADAEGLSGYRLVFNTGEDAGQTVFHAHLHVIGGERLTWPA